MLWQAAEPSAEIPYNYSEKISPPSYDFVMTARTFGNAQASLALRSLVLPVLLSLADVGLVAELGHLLSLGEEFLGLVGISLLH